jgi:hypothetical protein
MITNEQRAKLIGWKERESEQWPWFAPGERPKRELPSYDTDANAIAELRAFVRAQGKVEEFCQALFERTAIDKPKFDAMFSMLAATPQQLCAAFDATFKDELERINET